MSTQLRGEVLAPLPAEPGKPLDMPQNIQEMARQTFSWLLNLELDNGEPKSRSSEQKLTGRTLSKSLLTSLILMGKNSVW